MKIKNALAGFLPLISMGFTKRDDPFYYEGAARLVTRKTQLSNKEWQKRKKRISNEKHARAINRN